MSKTHKENKGKHDINVSVKSKSSRTESAGKTPQRHTISQKQGEIVESQVSQRQGLQSAVLHPYQRESRFINSIFCW